MFLAWLVRYAIWKQFKMHVGGLINGVRLGRVFDAKNAKNASEISKFDWLCLLKEQQLRVFLQD